MAESLMITLMKYCGSIILTLLCVVPLAAWGQVLSDPTRPPPGLGDAISSGEMSYPQVKGLQSVLISPAYCAAIIDGKTVQLGAKHGNERLVEVTERGVVMQGENGRRSVMMFPAVGIKIKETLPSEQQAATCKLEQTKQVKNPVNQIGQKEKK